MANHHFILLFLNCVSQVIPCAQRDALYCLHENGCITLRVCRSTAALEDGSATTGMPPLVHAVVAVWTVLTDNANAQQRCLPLFIY